MKRIVGPILAAALLAGCAGSTPTPTPPVVGVTPASTIVAGVPVLTPVAVFATPSPTQVATPAPTPSPSPSSRPSPSPSPSQSPSPSPSPSLWPTPSASPTPAATPSPSPTPSPTASPTPSPTLAAGTPLPSPIVLTGATDLNTAPFTLPAGDYRSDWEKAPGCALSTYLEPTDATASGEWSLGGSHIDGPVAGTTYVYGVPAGRYYARVQGSCHWTVTLTQQ